MVSFRGQKMGRATPRLVSFRSLIQNFRRASLLLSYGSPPPRFLVANIITQPSLLYVSDHPKCQDLVVAYSVDS